MSKTKTYYIKLSADIKTREIELLVINNLISLSQQRQPDVGLYVQAHYLRKQIAPFLKKPAEIEKIESLDERDFRILNEGWKISANIGRPDEWDDAIGVVVQLSKENWETQVGFDPDKEN